MIITISGMPGSGKTTIAKALCKALKLKYYSVGSIMRKMAKERGITITEMNRLGETNPGFDREIDDYQIALGKKVDNAVFDGRLSFHFIPSSIKILVKCRPQIGARRIFQNKRKNEQYFSVKDAVNYLKKRATSERKRFKEYYNVDVANKSNFDIVYDTSDDRIAQTQKKIVAILRAFIEDNQKSKETK